MYNLLVVHDHQGLQNGAHRDRSVFLGVGALPLDLLEQLTPRKTLQNHVDIVPGLKHVVQFNDIWVVKFSKKGNLREK